MVDEKLLDKLRKLKAHAESAEKIGSEAEAQAFASKLQDLLLTHKLAMTDVEWDQREANEPVEERVTDYEANGLKTKKVRDPFGEKLANIIARAHDCKLLLRSTSRFNGRGIRATVCTNHLIFIGVRSDVVQCEYTFYVLLRLVESIAEKAYCKFFYECQDRGQVEEARGFKSAFKWGFLNRLQERLTYERQAKEEAASSWALVHISKSLTRVQERYTQVCGGNARRISQGVRENAAGTAHGRAAADSVKLNKGIEATGAKPVASLR